MTGSSLGRVLRLATWGESHGPAIGGVLDGVPSRLALSEADIQPWLDRRRPGQSRFTTQRREPDQVKILSGVFQGQTTGAPIGFVIENCDVRSKDYTKIAHRFRPGHADYTYQAKYGIRDWRGGGRSSARETAMRVVAGAIARKILGSKIKIRGALIQMGPHAINRNRWRWKEIAANPFFCPDARSVETWATFLDATRKRGSSAGAIIEIQAKGVPAGWGEPVYDKLDADLAKAMMSIPAVKGVEIGAGFAAALLGGEENADPMRMKAGRPVFLSNHAGGILGGISTGQDIVVRFVVKPTSSIPMPGASLDDQGQEVAVKTTGRHDPCVGIRAVPVGEAMMALILADHAMMAKARG